MRYLGLTLWLIALIIPVRALAQTETVYSPGHTIAVNFDVKNGVPVYNVLFNGTEIIKKSRLGLELASVKGNGEFNNFDNRQAVNQNLLLDGFELMQVRHSSFDETWQPVWGEESSIRNHYNEMEVYLRQVELQRYITVRFRVYDDGVGLRYEFPQQPNLTYFVIKEEHTQFAMPD